MKFNRLSHLVFLLAAAANAGAGTPVFSGVSSFSGRTYFSLKQENTSAWLEIGERIGPYTVKEFDPASQTLTLTGEGGTLKLGLDPERMKNSPAGSGAIHGIDLAQLLVKSGVASTALNDLFVRHQQQQTRVAEQSKKLKEFQDAFRKEQEAEKDKKTGAETTPDEDRFEVQFLAEKRDLAINTEILKHLAARLSEVATAEYANLGASGAK